MSKSSWTPILLATLEFGVDVEEVVLLLAANSDREIHAPPHEIDDQHCECETGGGAYFAFFLGSDNSHTTPPKNTT